MTWIFWSLLSALFAGATAILAKLGVANINSNLATAARTSVVLCPGLGNRFGQMCLPQP
jgi:transporter family protein